jgi:hypothetical protein
MGTIHGANTKAVTPNINKVVEIQDNKDNVSVLMTKTVGDTQSKVVVGSRVASGSNPVSVPTTKSTPLGAAAGDQKILPALDRRVEPMGGRQANSHQQSPFYIRKRGDYKCALWIVKWAWNLKARRDQHRASKFRWKEAASRHHQLLSTCVKLKDLCINGNLKNDSTYG